MQSFTVFVDKIHGRKSDSKSIAAIKCYNLAEFEQIDIVCDPQYADYCLLRMLVQSVRELLSLIKIT
jgi:hypothetical protein